MPGKNEEQITVHVNGKPVQLYRGMKVRHALVSIESGLCTAVEEGRISVTDANGFEVGLDGALQDGSSLVLKKSG